ncbi:MAG: LytTR family DNA-binding domain-containing protein [Pseudomonadota bacterium]
MRFVANDTVLGETLAEAGVLAHSRMLWIGLASAALMAGLTGPFGTFTTMSLPLRLVYWGAVAISSYWLGLLVSLAVANQTEAMGAAPFLGLGFGAGAASLAVTLWLSTVHWMFLGASFPAEVIRLLPYSVVISVVVVFLFEALQGNRNPIVAENDPPTEPEWLDRLPTELGRELLLLQSQDHYLRAVTPLGETLTRGTIAEATEALGGYGVRVHRSWWVSHRALRAYRTRQGASHVELSTGLTVPVGRSYRHVVRDALGRASRE